MNIKQLITMAHQLLEGISALHAAEIAHRDLKPDNIILDKKGRYVIVDLGLACTTKPKQPLTCKGVAGSAFYIAPEMFMYHNGYISELPLEAYMAGDIWAFGIILLAMAAGGDVNLETKGQVERDEPRSLKELEATFELPDLGKFSIDKRIASLINAALTVSWERRPTSKELLRRLRRIK